MHKNMAKKKGNNRKDEGDAKSTKKPAKPVVDDNDEQNSEEEEQVSVPKQAPVSRAKPVNMFALLEDDEETSTPNDDNVQENTETTTTTQPEEEPQQPEEEETPAAKKKSNNKKDKGNKKKSSSRGADFGEDDIPKPEPKPQPEKKDDKNKKNDKKNVEKPADEEPAPAPAAAATTKPAPAKKDNKKKKNSDDYLSQLAEDETQQDAAPATTKPAPAATPAEPAKKADAGKKKKKGNDEDYLKQMAGEDDTQDAAPAPAPKDNKKKKDTKPEPEKKKDTKKDAPAAKTTPATSDAKKPSNAARSGLRELMEKKRAEEERIKKEQEEEDRQLKLLIEQREQERKEKEKAEKEALKQEQLMRKKGLIKSKKQLEDEEKKKAMVERMLANSYIEAFQKDKPEKQEKPKPKPKTDEEKQAEAAPKEVAPAKAEDEVADSWEDLVDEEPATTQEVKSATTTTTTAAKDTKTKDDSDDEPESEDKKDETDYRSPICCVLGHVDTGKTKLLDKIRNTNVQMGEAGGITQQIGATYVPMDAIKAQTKKLGEKVALNMKVPGLLIIDTPGHESFTNLRSRGTSLCDIAILVVDLMHGLERQTIESMNLLKMRKTPFIVALNKIDQLYDWKAQPNSPVRQSLKAQPKHTLVQFDDRLKSTLMQFQEQGFNAALYWENKDFKNVVSLVPTSAITGEGLPDLMALMVQLTQHFMGSKITFKDEFQCTILEVKVVEGHGTTIDVILSNGVINEGDTMVICGLNGPIVTNIRALLAPKPLKEIRVKGEYVHHKQIRAAMGIKIAAQDLEGAVPGSSVLIYNPKNGDNLEDLKDQVMQDLEQMLKKVSKSGKGVYVQSSTLGSLEALLEFLKSEKIPVSGINIGPVHKKDVIASSVMLEHNPEYAIIMAFDVPVTKDAQLIADKSGVKIFMADIIYHLCDKFMEHMKKIKEEKKKQVQMEAVWPCIIKVIPEHCFHNKDPITAGVDVVEGVLKVGTPLIIPTRDGLEIGRCLSIQHNKVSVNEAEKGKAVAIQIDSGKTITFGRHFDESDLIYSKMTRNSIDLLKQNFQDDLKKDDIVLIQKIKKVLMIPDASSKVKKDQ